MISNYFVIFEDLRNATIDFLLYITAGATEVCLPTFVVHMRTMTLGYVRRLSSPRAASRAASQSKHNLATLKQFYQHALSFLE